APPDPPPPPGSSLLQGIGGCYYLAIDDYYILYHLYEVAALTVLGVLQGPYPPPHGPPRPRARSSSRSRASSRPCNGRTRSPVWSTKPSISRSTTDRSSPAARPSSGSMCPGLSTPRGES